MANIVILKILYMGKVWFLLHIYENSFDLNVDVSIEGRDLGNKLMGKWEMDVCGFLLAAEGD